MTRQQGIGKKGMVLAAAVAGTMYVLAYWAMPQMRMAGNMGLCLPSPNLWTIPPLWSWAINGFVTLLMVLTAVLLNRHYNFIRTSQPIVAALFTVMAASNPFTIQYLSSSTLVCLGNLVCLATLFTCEKNRRATRQMFMIGTWIAIGSMVQHAFIPFILAYVGAAAVMKVFRVKEFLALLLGLAAPYWIGIGLGLIPFDSFRMPEFSNLFEGFAPPSDLMVIMVGLGCAMVFGFALGINNSIKLYAGNSRTNALNVSINLVGLVSMAGIVLDFSNMMAYASTLYLVFAVQVANLCALWSFRREWTLTFIPCAVYVVSFALLALN